ncbi:WD-40 repeat protein [Reticulomyxa filosa]|uniref:WD-40 repeat protein n=1 Tax=Reticulomyxa filosa TaxID=46433 RepID=X6NZ06_RETFI|nr:WD-40 repeat protein [Reticulomyxa filosa]|eukprot:ETO31118.1 WD-40 repeat protein [Reticulomyxa filosa]
MYMGPFLNKNYLEKTLHQDKETLMLALNLERDGKKLKHEKEIFSSSGCYDKDWIFLTNRLQNLNPLICCLCNQVANNAVELQCNEHENADQVYLIGEECLQTYLKQNNGKCPIQQHDNCEFSKNRIARQQVSDLLVVCPRQYDLEQRKSKEGIRPGEKEGYEDETNWTSKSKCNHKGKIKEMKDHLDKSCQLISIEQIISLVKELQSQLQTEKLQTEKYTNIKKKKEELKEAHLKNKKEIENLKESDNKKSKQIQQLNVHISIFRIFFKQIDDLQCESVKKDAQIAELTKNIQQLKLEIDQNIIQFKKQFEQCQGECNICTNKLEGPVKRNSDAQHKQIEELNVNTCHFLKNLSDDIKHLKSERQLNEKKQNEVVSKINNDNIILKQQLVGFVFDNLLTEIEQLKNETKSSKDQINQINVNHNEDKTSEYNNPLLQVKSNQSSLSNFDLFRSSSKLVNTLTGHTNIIWSIDYSTFNDRQFICSGSNDNTVRVWDINTNKQIRSFNGHSDYVYCVKFSSYHYYNHCCNIICSSSSDKTIRFWDIKHNQQLNLFNGHTGAVCGIEFSPFNNGRYLCSGSGDWTVRLWDVETSKSVNIFNAHENWVRCVDFSPLQSNNNKSNSIGVIGGNGYTICSGSNDNTIRIWDVETAKSLIVFKGHKDCIWSVKYRSNELGNTILSGSEDASVRLWDIRSCQQIQVFNEHTSYVYAVEYSPFVIKNNDSSNVICSASRDNTIRFWDIRSNKNQLHVIKGNENEDGGICCLKFVPLKKKIKNIEQKSNDNYSAILEISQNHTTDNNKQWNIILSFDWTSKYLKNK